MTKTDWTPEGQPSDESLSATGMFLSALGKESDQPQKPPSESVAQPVARQDTKQAGWPAEQAVAPSWSASPANPASAGATQGSPGEFTRLFQAAQSPAAAPPLTPAMQAPVMQSAAPSIEPKPAPGFAPGEFTRIFVKPAEAKPADRPPVPVVRSIPEAPPAPQAAQGSPRMKGFSSGASDSASADGGFTQFFQPRPSTPAPAAAPRFESFSLETPPPVTPIQATPRAAPSPAAPVAEIKWPRQPDFGPVDAPVDRGGSAQSVTNLFASLAPAGQGAGQGGVQGGGGYKEEIRQRPVEPLPSFSPPPPAAPSAEEPGSVTRLIQRLSESPRATPQAEMPQPPAIPAVPPSPGLDSGPGEFTRMISASAFNASAGAPLAPAAAPPPAAQPPAFAMPAALRPASNGNASGAQASGRAGSACLSGS